MIITIFGYGSIGKYYLKILNKNKFKKIYIVDQNIKKIRKYKNLIYVNDLYFIKNKIISNYAIICTPSHLHYKNAEYFLKNKCHVLIEKPFTLKYSDAFKLVNIKNKSKLKCWTVFQNRLNEPIKLLKKFIKIQILGEIQFIDCKLIWKREKKYYSDAWHGKYKTDGGVLTNQSIHLLDILVYLFGEVKGFNGNIKFNKKKLEAEDYIALNITLKNNIPVSYIATTRANKDYAMSIDVFGSKNRFKVSGIALNKFDLFSKELNLKYKKYKFNTKMGFGNKHKSILPDFFNLKSKDKFNLSIEKNLYLIKLINSVYHYLHIDKEYSVNKTKSILGYGKKK